jgi:hypothetical protein
MSRKSVVPIPEAIERLQNQLDQFRSTRSQRTKLPDSFWQAAAELARQYGVQAVARPLQLDYTGLKKRLGEVATPGPKKAKLPTFVELMPHPATVQVGEHLKYLVSAQGCPVARLAWFSAPRHIGARDREWAVRSAGTIFGCAICGRS